MKTLEQLGISPTPWRADTDKWGSENDVICEYTRDSVRKGERRTKVVARCNAYFETFKADIHVIAAAPDLYEAVLGLLEIVCIDCNSSYKVDGKCVKCPRVVAAEAALAKAGGEKEVEK